MKTIWLEDGTGVTRNYLMTDKDRHGNVRVYVRRHGRKVRIRDLATVEEFMAAYRAAMETPNGSVKSLPTAAAPGSLRWLVEKYCGSAKFRQLGESTRAARRGILDGICERYGSKPFARMEPRHVARIRDEKADLPEAANARLKALRQVFSWATSPEYGYAHSNPARDVSYLKSGNPDGFHTWTKDEIRQFEAQHPIGTKAYKALAIGLFAGVRRSDAVLLGRQMERDGWMHFTEVKGRSRTPKSRELPILPELRAALDASPSGHLTYLVTAFGKPFTARGFGNWFRKRCNEAGLRHCSFHGLRKAGATIAAENGATEHQLMAIYGWESPKQAALYTRKANRKRMAGDAMHLLIPDQTENESVPPSRVVSQGGTNGGKKE